MKKCMLIIFFALLSAQCVIAGSRPEFDGVGDDSSNYFNNFISEMVIDEAVDGFGNKINEYSNFGQEYFTNTAGALYPDPCFPGYLSSLVDAWSAATYEWQIVLQMRPQSDIDLDITNCVINFIDNNIWTGAAQTGRFRAPWGQIFFLPYANPSVTVRAYPGPYATPGFKDPFYLDARVGFKTFPLDRALFTGKALWNANIVMALPETGQLNSMGENCFNLKMGDLIKVTIGVPNNNSVNIRYGKDSVLVRYIGVIGTEYSTAVSDDSTLCLPWPFDVPPPIWLQDIICPK